MNQKIQKIVFNGLKGVAIPVFNFIIAAIGIKHFGNKDWGSFINILIWVYFLAFIANFGNKDFLLRNYSKEPNKINHLFLSSLISRSVFLIFSVGMIYFFPLKTSLLSIALCLLIYIYQSLDSIVIYKQKFGSQLVIELIGSSIIAFGILLQESLNLQKIISLYCLCYFIKIISQLIFLRIEFKTTYLMFSFDLIVKSFPFFLIGFSGWLASKIDLYMVSFYLPNESLAKYQIFISAFIMVRASAGLILYPFSKHLYRLPAISLSKIKKLLLQLSIPIIVLATTIIWFILENLIEIHFTLDYYLLGALSSFPIFTYILTIMSLYRFNKERIVLLTSFTSVILYLILSSIFIPLIEIKGALVSVIIIQFMIMIIYSKFSKRLKLNQ